VLSDKRCLQGRAEHTAGGMGSVSNGREEMWGQGSSCQQRQLQAAETWAGRERELLPETPRKGGDTGTACQVCSAGTFSAANPCPPLPPSTASALRGFRA